MPSKPQSVIIERWLPYNQVKRRVIFQRSKDADPIVVKPKNVIIQWEAPIVKVKKEFKDLGIIRANPSEYVARYGATLKKANELPPFVLEIKPPAGIVLASEMTNCNVHELEGDVEALQLIDLDHEGLSEYKQFVKKLKAVNCKRGSEFIPVSDDCSQKFDKLINEIFHSIDFNNSGKISGNFKIVL